MKIISINQNSRQIIKNTSIVLISAALILELAYLYTVLNGQEIPKTIEIIIWMAGFALFIHLIEGILAFFWAFSQQKNPFRSAIYTFFTGTISLLELFEKNSEVEL